MIDLSTNYLGFNLRSPLVASSSPLTKDITNIRRLEDAGAAAVVMHSLFEEQLTLESHAVDRMLSQGVESYAEAQSYFPDFVSYNLGPESYLKDITRAKRMVRIPVIGSLNGVSTGGWLRYAKAMEEAGADAIELNIYFLPTSPDIDGDDLEASYCELVKALKARVKIPVAVKLAPYFTSMANMAFKLDRAGADALVLFNRFYQPDFDLERMEVVPNLKLSTSDELRLRLYWVAQLANRIRPELAITGGVQTAEDVVKGIMAGANVVMMTSVLLKNGIPYLRDLEKKVVEWMQAHDYESVRQMRGSMSVSAAPDPAAFERANYLKVLSSYTLRAEQR
ncbi:MAG: dihydroorotate dehydrogenase-like protein [Bryobacteraceae bacterium]